MIQYQSFEKVQLKKHHRKHGIYTYEPSFADTETSNIIKYVDDDGNPIRESWIYIWGVMVGGVVYYGRTPIEFRDFLYTLIDAYELSDKCVLPIYFHNLPYDASYLYDILYSIDPELNMMCVSATKPFCIRLNCGIELRCSYKLVNKSLEKWGKDLNVEHKKLVGTIDYHEVHDQTEDLDQNQLDYFERDIVTLKECFYKELEVRNYKYWTVPFTSTGFVRDLFRERYNHPERQGRRDKSINERLFRSTKVNINQYDRLVGAAQGGMTLVSIDHIGETVRAEEGIGHGDFDSHYPTQQICRKMPMTPLTVYDEENGINLERILSVNDLLGYETRGYYYVAKVLIRDLRLRDGITTPFVCRSKIYPTCGCGRCSNVNGKVTRAEGIWMMYITNHDLRIFIEQYTFTLHVIALDIYTTAYLPSYVYDTIKDLYKDKTALKNKVRELKDAKASKWEIEDAELNLLLKKGNLNGVFGCTYTRIVRESVKYNNDTHEWYITIDDPEEQLEKYYKSRNNCLAYQWGVFTTAMARRQLWEVIKCIGADNVLYMDTDSCFYINREGVQERLNGYNKRLRHHSMENGFFVQTDGKTKYFNNFDQEKDSLKSKTFRSLHAKCYALEPDGVLDITIAGVSAYNEDHTISREDELGSIENMKNGFVFRECGGTRADYSTVTSLHRYGNIVTCGGCIILPNTKTLNEVSIDGDNIILEKEFDNDKTRLL